MSAREDAVGDGLAAGAVAAVLSGAPSTVHALVTGASAIEATLAAGTLALLARRVKFRSCSRQCRRTW